MKYKTIVIDPPWPGPGEARSMKGGQYVIPYQTMTGIQLASLRICDLAEQDASLWMWVTSRNMTDAGLLMQLWGFRYGGLHVWAKPSPTLGKWVRHDSEFLLRGVRPDSLIRLPAPVQTHHWKRPKRHSEKPAEAYAMIADLCPAPRIDIFARQARPGFTPWGNEAPEMLDAADGTATWTGE
jgi:N6-adenosine-specific RNA methylase IME4